MSDELDYHPDITHHHIEDEFRADGTVITHLVVDSPLEKQKLTNKEQEQRYDQLKKFLVNFIDGLKIDAVTIRPSSE